MNNSLDANRPRVTTIRGGSRNLVSLVSKALGNAESQLNSLRQAAAESAEPESDSTILDSLFRGVVRLNTTN